MRISLAIAAGALLVSVSAQAAASTVHPSPAASTNSLTANVRPAALRLKGAHPGERQAAAIRAVFDGSFVDAAGKEYSVAGMGEFVPSPGSIKYSATLNGFPLTPPVNLFDFGTMSGLGLLEEGVYFEIHGVMDAQGYVLDVRGLILNGRMNGEFQLFGNGGSGKGDFTSL